MVILVLCPEKAVIGKYPPLGCRGNDAWLQDTSREGKVTKANRPSAAVMWFGSNSRQVEKRNAVWEPRVALFRLLSGPLLLSGVCRELQDHSCVCVFSRRCCGACGTSWPDRFHFWFKFERWASRWSVVSWTSKWQSALNEETPLQRSAKQPVACRSASQVCLQAFRVDGETVKS